MNAPRLLDPTPLDELDRSPMPTTASSIPLAGDHLRATSADQPIPMRRLVKVELRKAIDTRAGKWLLATIGGGSVLVMAIMVIIGIVNDSAYNLSDFMTAANFFPMGLLLPVIGILSVTSEWGQRTNMVTFTLEPRRSRVVAAKLITGTIMALSATVIALIAAPLALGAFDLAGGTADWSFSASSAVAYGLVQLIGMFTGFAFGMVLLNTPGAIVSYFAYGTLIPTLFFGAASLWGWAESAQPWIDFNYSQEPLMDGSLGSVNWANFVVTATIWLVVPVILGARRLLRAEIK